MSEETNTNSNYCPERFLVSNGVSPLDYVLTNDDRVIEFDELAHPRMSEDMQYVEEADLSNFINDLMIRANTTYREREVLKLRFGLSDGVSYTLREVGPILKTSYETVRKEEKRALFKLRHALVRDPRGYALPRAFVEDHLEQKSNSWKFKVACEDSFLNASQTHQLREQSLQGTTLLEYNPQ